MLIGFVRGDGFESSVAVVLQRGDREGVTRGEGIIFVGGRVERVSGVRDKGIGGRYGWHLGCGRKYRSDRKSVECWAGEAYKKKRKSKG